VCSSDLSTYEQPFGGANPRRSRFDAAGNLLIGAISNGAPNNYDIGVVNFALVPFGFSPSSLVCLTGRTVSGTVADLAVSDDHDLTGALLWDVSRSTPNLSWTFTAVAPRGWMPSLNVTFESRSSLAGLRQVIQIKNRATGNWDTVSSTTIATADSIQNIAVTSGVASYVGPAGEIELKASYWPSATAGSRVVTVMVDLVRIRG